MSNLKVSDDTRAIMASSILASLLAQGGHECPYDSAWDHADNLVALAPEQAGGTAQTAEPTEEEWEQAFVATDRPFSTFPARMTTEAHRLAALRVRGEKP